MQNEYDKETLRLAELAKALSHPARVHILNYLAQQKECTFTEVYFELPITKATVSQHLKELKSCGLINSRSEQLKVKYSINQENMEIVKNLFGEFFEKIHNPD